MLRRVRKLIRSEAGYSLVEVIVSIFILAAAIIPMVGMFDVGLKSATSGGTYDKARALANTNLDKVLSLSYADATVTYKPTNAPSPVGTPVSCNQGIFTCTVTTTYLQDDLSQATITPTTKMKVVVNVQWQGKSYTTTGLKTQ